MMVQNNYALYMWLLHSSGPDLKVFLDPLELSNKDLIILAINDNSSSYSSGGTHW